MGARIPEKSQYKLGEVCEIADTQPYVLRFWESEFPQLRPRKNRSGHPVYTRTDVDLILRIKRLLHDEELTLADARAHLERPAPTAAVEPVAEPTAPATPSEAPERTAALTEELETTRQRLSEMRDRYDQACREIQRLRKTQSDLERAAEERDRARAEANALREKLAAGSASDDDDARALRAEVQRLTKERADLADHLETILETFLELTAGERAKSEDAPVS